MPFIVAFYTLPNRPSLEALAVWDVTYTIGVEVDDNKADKARDFTKKVAEKVKVLASKGRCNIITADLGQVRNSSMDAMCACLVRW